MTRLLLLLLALWAFHTLVVATGDLHRAVDLFIATQLPQVHHG